MATVDDAIAKFVEAAGSLSDLREHLLRRNAILSLVGQSVPSKDVDDYNKLRRNLASNLSKFTEFVRDQLKAADESSLGLLNRAGKFDDSLRQQLGTTDPGLALLEELPVLKLSASGGLAGLGALGAIQVGAVGGAALAIGVAISIAAYSISVAADSFFSHAADVDADTKNVKARKECAESVIESLQDKSADEIQTAVLAACGKGPPASDFPWWAVGLGVAVVVGWPLISQLTKKGLTTAQARLNGRRR